MFILRQKHVAVHTHPLLHARLFQNICARMFQNIYNTGQQFTQGEVRTDGCPYNTHATIIVKEDASFQNVPPRPLD
jgi:hypothetical protein